MQRPSDLVQQMGIDETLAGPGGKSERTGEASPAQLADDLEAMGATYVKVGQVLASRIGHAGSGSLDVLLGEELRIRSRDFAFEDALRKAGVR